ncbi:MAG: LysM peptidoglycan-binding domain-containing protein [Flavobacteriales bacterium]
MISRIITVLFCMLMLAAVSRAQETRTVNGRAYFVHKVTAGQTLYAISTSYAIPIDAIIASNPGSENGLSIDSELLLPKDAIIRKDAKNAPDLKANGEMLHTIAKKETLFGIAKKYGVDINELMSRNPQVNSGIRPGMDIVIPVVNYQGSSEAASRPASPLNTIAHLVQPGETVFALGKRFNVTVDAIKEVNGGLPAGLKAGDTVYIPVEPGTGKPFSNKVDPDSSAIAPDLQQYKITFLLPFSIGKNDSVLAAVNSEGWYYEPSRIAAQFYAGAKLALDSLQKIGLNAEVVVKDMGDEQDTWTAVLRDPDIARTDLFIGPFHRTAIEQLARIATRSHIVCPVPQSVRMILGNPIVSKITPTNTDMVRHAARYVAQRHSRDNVILVRADVKADKSLQDQMQSALQQALDSQPSKLRDSVLVVNSVKPDLKKLLPKLVEAKLNVIVAPFNDVEFSTALVGFLKQQTTKFRILVVGMESWLQNESIAASDLDQLGFLFASGSFADPADEKLNAFTRKFRDTFHTDVDDYAMMGFDATIFYGMALMTQGRSFPAHFGRVHTEPLFAGFRMTSTGPENGFRNEYAIMLQQKGLELIKAP